MKILLTVRTIGVAYFQQNGHHGFNLAPIINSMSRTKFSQPVREKKKISYKFSN